MLWFSWKFHFEFVVVQKIQWDFLELTFEYPGHCPNVCVCVLHNSHPVPSCFSLLTALWHICPTQWATADKFLLTQLHTLFRFHSFFLNVLFLFRDPVQDTAIHWLGDNLSAVGFYWFRFGQYFCISSPQRGSSVISILPTSLLGFWVRVRRHQECVGEQSSLLILWKHLCKIGLISPIKLVGNLPEKHSLVGEVFQKGLGTLQLYDVTVGQI